MDRSQFETGLRDATRQTGAEYLDTRRAILDAGPAVLTFLGSTQVPATDWKTALVVAVLAGWLTRKDLFDQCTRYVEGDLPGRPPITGKFSAIQRATTVARLGPDVVPRLLEMLIKTGEGNDAERAAAIFGSLVRIGDTRAVPPLIDLLAPPNEENTRVMAAGALGQLHDPRAAAPLRTVLANTSLSPGLRATAALSLGELRDSGSLKMLQGVLVDGAQNPEVRIGAARAIGKLGDSSVAGALSQALTTSHDLVLLQVVIETAARLGDQSSLPMLSDLASHHEDEFIREAAENAREEISRRAGAK